MIPVSLHKTKWWRSRKSMDRFLWLSLSQVFVAYWLSISSSCLARAQTQIVLPKQTLIPSGILSRGAAETCLPLHQTSSSFNNSKTVEEMEGRLDIPFACSNTSITYCYGAKGDFYSDELGKRDKSDTARGSPPRQVLLLFGDEEEQSTQLVSSEFQCAFLPQRTEMRLFHLSSGQDALLLEGHRQLALEEDLDQIDRSEEGIDDNLSELEEEEEEEDSDLDEENDEEWKPKNTTPGQDCSFVENWMDPEQESHRFVPSSCQSIHEINSSSFSLVNCGSSRCVFEVKDGVGHSVVVKMGMFNNVDYQQEVAHFNAWKDTVILERLSWSPYVLQLYGSCATTQVTEVASGGNLLDFVTVDRHHLERSNTTPQTKLKMAYHIMKALADIHQLERSNVNGWAMVSHNDFYPHQMLLVDGVIKLNDFHLADFAKLSNTDGTPCLEVPSDTDDYFEKVRSPEEMRFRYISEEELMDRTKSDVWYSAESLYHILTNKWMFEGYERDTFLKNILFRGRVFDELLSEEELGEISHPAERAIVAAIRWAWEFRFWNRPSARQLADFLERQLVALYGDNESENTLWRFDVSPLPSDYSFETAEKEYHDSLGCPLDDSECIQYNRNEMSDWRVTAM